MPFAELDESTGVVLEGAEALERLSAYITRLEEQAELADAGLVGVYLDVAELSKSHTYAPDTPKNSKVSARKSKEERGIVVKSIAPFAPVGRRPATNFLAVFSPTPVHV